MSGYRTPGRKTFLTIAALAMICWASASFACPVCFGDSDDPIIKGLEASILFMVGITYFLIVSGVVTFVLLRRRALRLQEQAAAETSQG